MSDISEKTSPPAEKQELYFSVENQNIIESDQEWYQDNLDIVFPMLFIATGLFQFILRKWILPVSEDVLEELENQFPTQSLSYNPIFGLYLMGIGAVLLDAINVYKLI